MSVCGTVWANLRRFCEEGCAGRFWGVDLGGIDVSGGLSVGGAIRVSLSRFCGWSCVRRSRETGIVGIDVFGDSLPIFWPGLTVVRGRLVHLGAEC
jgi:hypothetical protein